MPPSFSSAARVHPPASRRTPALRLALAETGVPKPPPVPRTGVVLIGTPRTILALHQQLQSIDPAPVVAGCIPLGLGPLPVASLGTPSQLAALHARLTFRLAIISLPSSMSGAGREIQATLQTLGVPSRLMPAIEDVLDEATPASDRTPTPALSLYRPPPPLDLAALVGRTPHSLNRPSVAAILTGKRILITGAGGSIGSELARVAAAFDPECLILMERGENALFEVDRQLAERFPAIRRKAVLHDVADADGTLRHLIGLRPHAVFHAAAHKHVPLMEDHPGHAVTNNLFGTKSIADAALAVGAERFVLVSSDKAVNPRSVMGATKRLAEMYVRSVAKSGGTRLSMVRFGNVLGSACSVLTIWTQQLADGGPLTVTDPRMTRYFMTIPEAATLVVQSAAVANDGSAAPVFVLDMGQPVRILDLAVRFAKAQGLTPRVRPETLPQGTTLPTDLEVAATAGPCIDIVFTGSRPGEKLHEELAYKTELLVPTGFSGINAWAGPPPERHPAQAGQGLGSLQMISDLSAARHATDRSVVLDAIRRHVPEMAQ